MYVSPSLEDLNAVFPSVSLLNRTNWAGEHSLFPLPELIISPLIS